MTVAVVTTALGRVADRVILVPLDPAEIAEIERQIREVEIEGLRWGDAFGVEDIAFGLQRLHVQCCIVNDLVGVDMVTDAVEALEVVGSTAPGTMNRLG